MWPFHLFSLNKVYFHGVFCMFKSLLTFRTEGEDLEGGLKEDSNNTNCQKRKVYLSVWKNLKDVVVRSKIITTINCIGILKRPQNVTSSKTENAWRKCVLIFYSALKKMSSISITSINHRKKLSKSNSFLTRHLFWNQQREK